MGERRAGLASARGVANALASAARAGVLLAVLGTPLAAQRAEDLALVDSAAIARAAWARGVAAFRAQDLATARAEIERAARAWPTQPAYVWGRALIAARRADTAGLLRSLDDYARLGLGRDLRADSSIARYLGLPGFAAVVAAVEANRAPLVHSRVRASFPDSTFWPEGMDHDAKSGNFYLASVRHGTIAELTPAGAARELWPRHQHGMGAILGVRVDPQGGVLWATSSGLAQMEGFAPGDSSLAALLRVRLSDGALERRWELPVVPGGHVLGDLAVGPHGDVFLTDSNEPVLYRLRPGGDSLEPMRNPLFRSLQGLAPTPDGRALYLADYSHGLLRVDLASGAVIRVADLPGSTSLGCDGIAWDRGAIVAVQNGILPPRIVRFRLDSGGVRIVGVTVLDRNLPLADEPTIGAVVGDSFVYVANSQWEKYSDHGSRRAGTALSAPVLLAVPLPR